MKSASRAEFVLRLFVENTPPLDAATIMAVRRVSRRLAAAPLAKHALILTLRQSRQLYALRQRPDVARLLVVNVHTLDLSNTPVVDVSALGRVHTLSLWGTPVVDVSALGRVHTLNLGGIPVVDVSALGRVHTLDLSNTRVVNVSALGRVHSLNLSHTRVVDVSALGRVHTLNLSRTRVVDVSALDDVVELWLPTGQKRRRVDK